MEDDMDLEFISRVKTIAKQAFPDTYEQTSERFFTVVKKFGIDDISSDSAIRACLHRVDINWEQYTKGDAIWAEENTRKYVSALLTKMGCSPQDIEDYVQTLLLKWLKSRCMDKFNPLKAGWNTYVYTATWRWLTSHRSGTSRYSADMVSLHNSRGIQRHLVDSGQVPPWVLQQLDEILQRFPEHLRQILAKGAGKKFSIPPYQITLLPPGISRYSLTEEKIVPLKTLPKKYWLPIQLLDGTETLVLNNSVEWVSSDMVRFVRNGKIENARTTGESFLQYSIYLQDHRVLWPSTLTKNLGPNRVTKCKSSYKSLLDLYYYLMECPQKVFEISAELGLPTWVVSEQITFLTKTWNTWYQTTFPEEVVPPPPWKCVSSKREPNWRIPQCTITL